MLLFIVEIVFCTEEFLPHILSIDTTCPTYFCPHIIYTYLEFNIPSNIRARFLSMDAIDPFHKVVWKDVADMAIKPVGSTKPTSRDGVRYNKGITDKRRSN